MIYLKFFSKFIVQTSVMKILSWYFEAMMIVTRVACDFAPNLLPVWFVKTLIYCIFLQKSVTNFAYFYTFVVTRIFRTKDANDACLDFLICTHEKCMRFWDQKGVGNFYTYHANKKNRPDVLGIRSVFQQLRMLQWIGFN